MTESVWSRGYRLATQLRRRGRTREALAILSGLLARDNRHANVLMLKGKCLLDLEQHEQAVAVYSYLRDLHPDRSEPVYCHAYALDRMERTSDAAEVVER